MFSDYDDDYSFDEDFDCASNPDTSDHAEVK